MENSVPPPSPPPPPPPPAPPLVPPPLAPTTSRARGRRGGRGWMVFALILLVLLFVSVATQVGRLLSSFAAVGPLAAGDHRWLEEVVLEHNRSRHKIALLEIQGMITSLVGGPGGSLVELIEKQLRRAAEDSAVRAVVLHLETPGGEVVASDEIARLIREFQQKSGKPVVAAMGAIAASGGYYVAAPCRWIVAHELTLTGSIGVIMSSFNYRGLLDKIGVRPEVYKSGRFKDMLRGSKSPEEILPEERQMVQSLIDDTLQRFKSVVREGRTWSASQNQGEGRALSEDWETYTDGRILSGAQALEHGFVDELGNLDQALARARKLAGIADADVVTYRAPFSLGNLFRLLGQSEQGTVKVDLGFEVPQLKAGQMYFLPGVLFP
jgi:protease-4